MNKLTPEQVNDLKNILCQRSTEELTQLKQITTEILNEREKIQERKDKDMLYLKIDKIWDKDDDTL